MCTPKEILSTPGITLTPPHPKHQNNNINNNQIKISENYLKGGIPLKDYRRISILEKLFLYRL